MCQADAKKDAKVAAKLAYQAAAEKFDEEKASDVE